MKNLELASLLNEIADLLEVKGESPFRVNAYRRAARAMESLTEDIEELAARGALEEIPGVGKSIAEKIREYLHTGRIAYHAELLRELPAGITTLLRIPGLGPKTAMLIYQHLGITTLEELEQAARSGRLVGLPRMGQKTVENILRGIEQVRRAGKRLPLGTVRPYAQEIVARLQRLPSVHGVRVAGSLRRMKDTIGDIDILVTSSAPEEPMETFVRMPEVGEVLSHGPTRSSVLLRVGIQADLRVVEPICFGAALQYFTGSKGHNIKLRERAVRMGLKINEYGVFRGERRIAGRTEEEVYAAVGLPWIPPELREDQGELEVAERGALPKLVTLQDIRGDLHMHTRWSDGTATVEEMARAARELGYEYICITDHSQSLKFAGGVTVEDLRRHIRDVRRLSERLEGIVVLIGSEVDILPDGSLDYPDEVLADLDVVVASVHTHFRMDAQAMTERIVRAMHNPYVTILGHPTGRLVQQRDPYSVDVERLVEAARRTGTILEVNAAPERLDLKDVHVRLAVEHGALLCINTDAHSPAQLRYMELGVGTARRGWAEAKDVVNTLPLRKLLEVLGRKRPAARGKRSG
ncbi:MAG: DNA polymerase/3'-5' exonuclease PolX [Armatimonadetes bacterium]|nr:DNA polymerase/3'-5' exonuclease PolX [Armatimonadota bacterium]MDW8152917.1 DNA polymerase/3'-5' exonuclease PolX [Armatimonadota bacterium]